MCNKITGTRLNPVLLCDGCNKGYHAHCLKVSQLPDKDCDWLCPECRQPGQRISVFFPRDKKWHHGVIKQHFPGDVGTEIAYENGARATENLDALRWRPVYTTDLSPLVAHIDEFMVCNAQNLSVWLATTPKTLTHLKKFPEVVQEKWKASRLKEFESIVRKGALEIIDRSQVPSNAICLPMGWVFKLKLDGTLKSRIVLLGNLMPADIFLDLSSPTPRLSSVRFFLTLILKLGLEAELLDIDTAFTYSTPHTVLYGILPDGLYDDGRLDGKCCHLLRTLYGADSAPRMFHDLLHNFFISENFTICPHEPTLYFKWIDGTPILVLVHVDDCLCASSSALLDKFKQDIRKLFNIGGPRGS